MPVILPLGINSLVKTLRLKWNGEKLPDSCVVTFWHSKMIAGWYISKSNAVALVSASKDGNYLTSILRKWNYHVVRGSSSKHGIEALHQAIDLVTHEKVKRIVITPDGPRGPKEVLKRGAFIAASELSIPLFFLHIKYRDGMKLTKSWDKFELPYPFSVVEISTQRIDTNDFPIEKTEQREYLEHLSQQLRQKQR